MRALLVKPAVALLAPSWPLVVKRALDRRKVPEGSLASLTLSLTGAKTLPLCGPAIMDLANRHAAGTLGCNLRVLAFPAAPSFIKVIQLQPSTIWRLVNCVNWFCSRAHPGLCCHIFDCWPKCECLGVKFFTLGLPWSSPCPSGSLRCPNSAECCSEEQTRPRFQAHPLSRLALYRA